MTRARHSTLGLAVALALILGWAGSLAFLLTRDLGADAWAWAPAAVLVQTWLSTGLFITAHDAMHGTVFPADRRVNDLVGRVAVLLYALFDYRVLCTEHGSHHAAPARPGDDPDYHDGEHPGWLSWLVHFARHYVGWRQVLGMAVAFNVLEHLVGVPAGRLLLFWVLPLLLSVVQLFHFGTFLPHRAPHAAGDPHRARSVGGPAWWSLVSCFHFGGFHREHHASPGTPWWRLPSTRSRGPSPGLSPTMPQNRSSVVLIGSPDTPGGGPGRRRASGAPRGGSAPS